MKKLKEILLIDDKFMKWKPILGNVSAEYGFSITSAPSVEEGLEKLKHNRKKFVAIILSLTFPEGKMQGREGLLKIKEFDKEIPVIILTAKTDDYQLVSECIRLGAHDYFIKKDVDPGQLFIQIENAIQLSKKRGCKAMSFVSGSELCDPIPFFHVSQKYENQYDGYFAYILDGVVCANEENPHELENLLNIAKDWHINLLNTITYYDLGITLRLRYIYIPGKDHITTVLIIAFSDKTPEEARLHYEEIHRDLNLFILSQKEFHKNVYYFLPVTEENELMNCLFPFNTDNFVQFVPEFPRMRNDARQTIGFTIDPSGKQTDFTSLPFVMDPQISLDSFCERMTQQKHETMIDIVLNTVKLNQKEVDFLMDLYNNIIISNKITANEKALMGENISAYLHTASKCFNVEVYCAQNSQSIGKSLFSAVSEGFFEKSTHISSVSVPINKSVILKKMEEPGKSGNLNNLYSIGNVSNIFKLPYPLSSTIPGIRTLFPIFGYIPENLSKTGVLAGVKNVMGMDIPIRINITDLRKHLYILGQTGTGKTTILYSMIMDRIASGNGICVIDPHGDLHSMLLENIPENRKKDVINFVPGSTENTIRINLLEYDKQNPQEKSFLIDELFNFFRQEYSDNTMGPMFELFMKNSLLLLMDDADNIGSIGDVVNIFQDVEFRKKLLMKCKNKHVFDFWNETAVKLTGDYSLANFTPYVTSKLNQLTINDYINPIVVTPKSNIDFREIIDNNKILLVSLSKGKIGKIGVNILGTVILSRIISAAFSRENIPENKRKDFTLFIDEFQNFASQSAMEAVSEARKYRLNLVFANQTLWQLSEQMKQSVLANVGSTFFFRPGVNEVDYIMPHFAPFLSRRSVLTLPNYKCIARLQIDDHLSLPFIFDTIRPDKLGNYIKT